MRLRSKKTGEIMKGETYEAMKDDLKIGFGGEE